MCLPARSDRLSGDPAINLRFWGVRGSIACGGPDTVRYGGNTACIELRCGSRLVVLDAGTGLRPLGNALARAGTVDADLLLTHTHLDHCIGLPFFAPMFDARNRVRIWAGHLPPSTGIRDVLALMMAPPLFPVPPDIFRADIAYCDFVAGASLRLPPTSAGHGAVEVRTLPLAHPDGATGYRIEHAGRSACYLSDLEHQAAGPTPALVDFVRDADVVVYDAMYTDEQFEGRVGWGHSTWQAGMRLADAANAGSYIVFHHDPEHDDAQMDAIALQLARARPGTAPSGLPRALVAREGMALQW